MTPLAAFQTGLSVVIAYFVWQLSSGRVEGQTQTVAIVLAIIALAMLIFFNVLVRRVRFGRFNWFGYNLIDIPLAPFRLPLAIVANVLAIVAPIANWEGNARKYPSLEYHGFSGCVMLYLFGVLPNGSASNGMSGVKTPKTEKVRTERPQGSTSSEDRGYKWKNVFHQFLVLLLTCVHSILALVLLLELVFNNEELGTAWQWIIGIAALLVYIYTALCSAQLKGVNSDFDYYDPRQIDKVKYVQAHTVNPYTGRKTKVGDPVEVERKRVQNPGMKNSITFGMILYYIFGLFIVFDQLLVFVLAIILPAGASVRPCRAKDAYLSSFGEKLRYFFLGIA